jgi:hypothetical protein
MCNIGSHVRVVVVDPIELPAPLPQVPVEMPVERPVLVPVAVDLGEDNTMFDEVTAYVSK